MATVSTSGSPFAHRLTGGYKCQSRPYAHRTYTPALISTYSPYCLHVTTNAHQSDTRFCACHAPKVRASAGSLSSSSFVRRDQRVRSHTHLPAALVRHDDRPIPVDIIGFPRSESPDLCEASSALVPYYRGSTGEKCFVISTQGNTRHVRATYHLTKNQAHAHGINKTVLGVC